MGERQGTPWTGHQTITGLTHRDRQPFTLTFTPTANLESPINLHVFGLWEEAGVPGENPRRYEENAQTPHRKVLPLSQTPHRGAHPKFDNSHIT